MAADSTFQVSDDYNPDGAIPSMSLVGPGGELLIKDVDSFSENMLLDAMGL